MDFCPRTGRPIVNVAERMVGRTIAGKYRLTRSIGEGGMGTIFEAEHALIGNRVAVKLLHEPFAEKREPVQRLYREAQATGAIGHPNIIKVHDVGETEEGVPFLVMELLDGESLGEHIDRHGPRPLGFVLDLGVQILSALNAAHEAGIIHRDLKCDNIFMLRNDENALKIKILDFGISKFAAPEMENLKLTQTGSVLGTPYYMAPEQASGKKDLDYRIDIYAAGVILYEALLGTIPHSATNYNALLIEIITEDVAPFRWLRPDVPARLEAAVLRALARNRDERWPSAVDFMEELVSIRAQIPPSVLHGSPVLEAHVPRVDRESQTLDVHEPASFVGANVSQMAFETGDRSGFRRMPRSRRKAAAVAAAGVLAAALLVVVLALLGTRGAQPAPAPQAPRTTEVEQPEVTDPAPPERVRLVVRTVPPDARVTANGEAVPAGGLELERGRDPVAVRIAAAGYEAQTIAVVPERDVELDVELTAAEPAGEGDDAESATPANVGKRPGKRGGSKRPPKVGVTPSGGAADPSAKPPKKKPKPGQALDRPMDNPF